MANKAQKFTVARSFSKDREGSAVQGHIGAATFEVEVVSATLNGKELPRNSVEHLFNFALQTLQDSYAGAKTLTDAQESYNAKLEKLLNGTLGARGEGVDSFTKVARQVTYAILKKKESPAYDEIKEMESKKDQVARLDEIFALNEAAFRPVVEKEIEKRKQAAEENAKVAEAIEIKL